MSEHVPAGAIPEPVLELCGILQRRGFGAWVVGGGLRDVLRGVQPDEWDIATTARPEQVQRVFRHVIPTGIAHGTVTVLFRGGSYEVTTLRGETSYSDGRRPDSVHYVEDLEHDLARRDFTVNAMAFDPTQGRFIDPFGGLADMRRGVLRTVGDPAERFGEDGLRVLRAARFVATLQYSLEPATEAAIGGALEVFRRVSHERVRDEWLKAMTAPEPSRAFRVMQRSGILEVSCPELMKQVGCTQNAYHAYDVWEHSLACLDAADRDPAHRVAALLHDLGKPKTRQLSDKTGDYTFYNHEHVGARMADEWLREYRFSNDERQRVVHLIRHHLVCYSDEWSDAAVRRFVRRVGPEHVDELLSLARADALAKGRPVDDDLAGLAQLRARIEALEQAGSALSVRDLAVNGRDVMAELDIRPGPQVGRILEQLMERVLDDPSVNEREQLLAMTRELAAGAE